MNQNTADMLRSDNLFDKTSLVYENGVLKKIEDPLDSDDIPEGRLGEFPVKRVKTGVGIPVFLPLTRAARALGDVEADEDTPQLYQLCTENRFLSLKKLPAEEAAGVAEECGRNEDLLPWGDREAGNAVSEWVGMVDSVKYGQMLGTVSFLSGSDRCVYILTYAGTGNFTDIRMEKDNILNMLRRRVSR